MKLVPFLTETVFFNFYKITRRIFIILLLTQVLIKR